jgi:hypothetical protein
MILDFSNRTWVSYYIMSQQYVLVSIVVCLVNMAHRTTNLLDDTLPLDRNAPGFGIPDNNKTYYGSDLSMSTSKKSNDSSVKYLYEVVNLTDSKSDDNKDQFVKLRSGR